jgi:hypothetical protein
MNVFLLIASILQALAAVARNPELGAEANSDRYSQLLEFLARLVQRGEEAVGELSQLRIQVESILARGSPPTDDEIAAWKSRSDAAHAELQALKTPAPPAPEEDVG